MKKIFIIATFIFLFLTCGIVSQAHSASLDVDYDNCTPSYYVDENDIGDGYDEKWYEFSEKTVSEHIAHNPYGPTVIKYYINPVGETDTSLTWNTGLTTTEYNTMMNSLTTSIEKWNKISFYVLDSNNVLQKKRLVNIYQGTASDHNVIIYPTEKFNHYAGGTWPIGDRQIIDAKHEEEYVITHVHNNNWGIEFNLTAWKYHFNSGIDIFYRTGAHEIGHVLGLRDIDEMEGTIYHHEELLMGYSLDGIYYQQEITYKDIAGVAITRGMHTDADHKWLYDVNSSSAGNYKLICSICNGTKRVSDLSGYAYNFYKKCNGDHKLSSGNMMPVASYETKDYYKCRYCRYVAPFTSCVSQNYTYRTINESSHRVDNIIVGLEYNYTESHTFINNASNLICSKCGYTKHVHSYGAPYTWYDYTKHTSSCSCNIKNYEPHAVAANAFSKGQKYAKCLRCGGDAMRGFDQITNSSKPSMKSTNGSYILPNGVLVIVDADLDAYFNNTLTFYLDSLQSK